MNGYIRLIATVYTTHACPTDINSCQHLSPWYHLLSRASCAMISFFFFSFLLVFSAITPSPCAEQPTGHFIWLTSLPFHLQFFLSLALTAQWRIGVDMERYFAGIQVDIFSLHICTSSYVLYIHYRKTKLPVETNASRGHYIALSSTFRYADLPSQSCLREALRDATSLLSHCCHSQQSFRGTLPSYYRVRVCCMSPPLLQRWITLFQAICLTS